MSLPAYYHTTVLLQEAVAGLAVRKDGVYVDATFGGGGHSRLLLSQLGDAGRLIAFDQDAAAWQNKPEDKRLIVVRENFRYLRQFLRLHGHPQVDGILADLGVSSFQFDTATRGFSIRFNGPLDMRMDQRTEITAAYILKTYSEAALHQMLEQYGGVRNARQLARHIAAGREKSPLDTVEALKALVDPVMRGNPNRYLAQLFQALRIAVNEEMDALKELLQQSAQSLRQGGRLSVITFHSLEDRLVKQFIKHGTWDAVETDMLGVRQETPPLKAVNPKPIEPTEQEIKQNPRARSARLRIAEKI
jgi:16S rRNA (cytosine1402-N4)-methyltransferase